MVRTRADSQGLLLASLPAVLSSTCLSKPMSRVLKPAERGARRFHRPCVPGLSCTGLWLETCGGFLPDRRFDCYSYTNTCDGYRSQVCILSLHQVTGSSGPGTAGCSGLSPRSAAGSLGCGAGAPSSSAKFLPQRL